MTWEKDFEADIKRIRALLKSQLGVSMIEFDDRGVPGELRELVPIAGLLGIGDDGVRADVVETMSEDFRAWVQQRVQAKQETIVNWVATKPWDATRSAFLALEEGFGYVGTAADADPSIASAILGDLKRLKL